MLMFFNVFAYQLGNLIVGFMFALCLTPRFAKIPRYVYALSFFVISAWPSMVKFYITEQNTLIHSLSDLCLLIMLIIVFTAYKDPIWKKVLIFLLMAMVMFVSEEITFSVMGLTADDFLADSLDVTGVMVRTIAGCILLFFVIPIILLWRTFLSDDREVRGHFWLGIFLTASQFILITLYSEFFFEVDNVKSESGAFVLVACMLLEMGLMLLFAGARDRYVEVQQAEEIKNKIEFDHKIIDQIMKSNERMAVRRHDRNNAYLIVKRLMEEGKTEEAKQVRNSLYNENN